MLLPDSSSKDFVFKLLLLRNVVSRFFFFFFYVILLFSGRREEGEFYLNRNCPKCKGGTDVNDARMMIEGFILFFVEEFYEFRRILKIDAVKIFVDNTIFNLYISFYSHIYMNLINCILLKSMLRL